MLLRPLTSSEVLTLVSLNIKLPPLPGTQFIRGSGTISGMYWCSFHKENTVPVWIGEGELRYPACLLCITIQVTNMGEVGVPEKNDALVLLNRPGDRKRSWRDIESTEWENVCMADGCYEVADSNCHVCQKPLCFREMYQQGTFGLCNSCKEAGHAAFE